MRFIASISRGESQTRPYALLLIVLAFLSPGLRAEDNSETRNGIGDSIEVRLEAIDQQVRILGRLRELEQEAATERAKTTPIPSVGREGVSFKSADGTFLLRPRFDLQPDARFFPNDDGKTAADAFVLRRVRVAFDGTAAGIYDFRLMADYGEGRIALNDAYLDARFLPQIALQVGKMKGPVGLERLQSITNLLFVELGLPTNLVPNRDLGVVLHGDLFEKRLSYWVGGMNGVTDGGSADADTDDGKDLVFRLFSHPFAKNENAALTGLGVGVGGSRGRQSGTAAAPNLPAFRTASRRSFFAYRSNGKPDGTSIADGWRTRVSPQAYYYYGRFGLLAEVARSSQEVSRDIGGAKRRVALAHDSWQVASSFLVTEDTASYRGVSPKKPLDPKKGAWGAVEIAFRVGALRLDEATFPDFADPKTAPQEAQAWAVGLNWYWNRNLKTVLNYEQTRFTGNGGNAFKDENVILQRFQLAL